MLVGDTAPAAVAPLGVEVLAVPATVVVVAGPFGPKPALPPAPELLEQLRLGFVPVCSRRPMIEVVGPQPPIVPTSHRRNVCAHGVSHVPRYTLPKPPRRPTPELRAVPLPPVMSFSRSIFILNSAWNQAVIPPPRVSVERRPQFEA